MSNTEIVRKILKSLGTPRLVSLYGESNVNAISAIIGDAVTESRLVDLLFNKMGTQILANRDIRNAVLSRLTPSERHFVLDGDGSNDEPISAVDAERLYSLKWGRRQASAERLLRVLGLDDSYLPPIADKKPDVEEIIPETWLYPHQLRLKDMFVRYLAMGKGERILIHMPTGAGKTRTSIEGVIEYWKCLADRKMNIVWIAHSEELCEQAFETFKTLWSVRGDRPVLMNRLWGPYVLKPQNADEGQIIIAGFQKLYSMITSSKNEIFTQMAELRKSACVIVVDEAHKVIAPTYRVCVEFLMEPLRTKLIGLTATPGRSGRDIFESADTETHELSTFFARSKLGLVDEDGADLEDPIGYLQERQFLARIVRKRVTTNISLELSENEMAFVSEFLEIPNSVLSKLAKSDERNALILGEIAALVAKGRQVIVFAITVQHARLINELLNLKNIKSKCIDGETDATARASSIAQFKVSQISVIVNYGVLTTGFDAPNTNAIVITRPTASLVLYSQMIGRGIRGKRVGGNDECYLVDLEDNLVGFPSERQAFNHFNSAWS